MMKNVRHSKLIINVLRKKYNNAWKYLVTSLDTVKYDDFTKKKIQRHIYTK